MAAIADLLEIAGRAYGSGNLLQAQQACVDVLQQDPNQAHALHWLGVIHHRLGRPAEAVVYLRLAARVEPLNFAIHSNLGMACAAAGKIPAAAAHYREALRLKPTHAEAHNNLGIVLAGQGQFAEAITHYREALRLNPDDSAAHNNLAGVLLEQGDVAGAEEQYRQAIRLKPDYAAALTNLAGLLIQKGQLDQAIRCCQEALQLDPDALAAYTHLGELAVQGLYQLTDAQRGRMEELLRGGTLTPEDASQLHFLLAAHQDRQGQEDQAFSHYQNANNFKLQIFRRKNQAFDPVHHRRFIDDLIAMFDEGYFERVHGFGLDTEKPIFIVGMPRSGSTLVAQILSSHPRVVAAGELRNLAEIVSSPPAAYPASLAGLDRETARALAMRYLQRLSSLGDTADRVVDKMPHNFLHLGSIFALFPQARIIHCRRDPLDSCLSCYFQNFTWVNYACSLEDLGFYYRQYERLMQHWRRVLPKPIYEVEYEDLVANQERVSRELVAYCGLDWNNRCLSFHQNSRTVQTASKLQVRRPLYASSVARWRRYERHLAPLQRALGLSELSAGTLAAFESLCSCAGALPLCLP